jgi:hypothetical protein
VFGIPDAEQKVSYIYDTQYDLELLKALSRKRSGAPKYRVHPAFWPALRIKPPPTPNEPSFFEAAGL